jgi:DNA-binding MarR family transcriptional regulator
MNKLIHEQSRLRILALLASEIRQLAFTELRDSLSMTAGNLSIQIKTLEEAGYVKTEKSFVDNKPRTDVSITQTGQEELMHYLEELESLLANVRVGKKN